MVPETPALMIQGTGSNVGKSLLVAGLCRLFARAGRSVRPFKPQNMSNNAAVTPQGGEIGRAQALQARAAGVEPSVDMNPVLLKPQSERGAQVIVQGRRWATLSARDYAKRKPELLTPVLESFHRLGRNADLILIEGAGSPAEINLRANDIANMGFAAAADVPVVIVGDIDRGGVIAALVGTFAVLPEDEQIRIKGFIVNKFRGDPSLFSTGATEISNRTGWPSLGLVPHFPGASRLPAEDSVDLDCRSNDARGGPFRIAVPRLARIANFDDLDPLRLEPGVDVIIVPPGEALPGDADLVILPGSKATMGDLDDLRAQGWDIDIAAHHRRGRAVLGLCGGYQMLGTHIADPQGLEGQAREMAGLGLLEVRTTLAGDKRLAEVHGHHLGSGCTVRGYEIHLGRTEGPDRARPLFKIGGRAEGAISADGLVMGTYLHGAFAGDDFRGAFLASLGAMAPGAATAYDASIEAALDGLADHLADHLDLSLLAEIAGLR